MTDSVEAAFPGLHSSGYELTSPADAGYNCIAWAAGEEARWWWPDEQHQYFWPADVPRACTVDAFAQMYAHLGYERCTSAALERGLEKVAIFVNADGAPTHAARQLSTGKWTSKLGCSVDIVHALKGVEGRTYGSVALVLKRTCIHPVDVDRRAE